VPAGPEGRMFAVERPFVFPLVTAADPRAPSNLVPACVKWINDELDDVPSLCAHQPDSSLAGLADAAHQEVVAELRALSSQASNNTVRLATARDGGGGADDNADEWDQAESDALHHVVHTIDLLRTCFATSVTDQDHAHASVTIGERRVDVLAVRGETHQQCSKHAQQFTPSLHRQVLLVSRDHENAGMGRRSRSFLQPEETRLGKRQITDPDSATIHIDYQSLLHLFQNAPTVAELAEGINARLAA
jgi:hypothetical protein